MSFKEWLAIQESSPQTRSRDAAAKGIGVPKADYNSRSTPTPWEGEQNEKAFKATHKKKKKGKGLTFHKPSHLISVGPDGAPNKKKS